MSIRENNSLSESITLKKSLQYAELLQRMKTHYSTARVCRYLPPMVEDSQLQDIELKREFDDYDLDLAVNKSCLPTLNLEPGNLL